MQTPSSGMTRANLSELVDNTKLGPVQWGVFTLCLLCVGMPT